MTWRAITALPHALNATLSLLAAEQLDRKRSSETAESSYSERTTRPASALSIRQAYATAIIRLVNGLVDPLQMGAYARSIAAIAAQIGFPQWLVELRHAATHEELPSLELLRSATDEVNVYYFCSKLQLMVSTQALTWLLHNYFLPSLSETSTSSSQSSQTNQLQAIRLSLKQYKSISKTVSRDASLQSEYADELAKAIRDIERWAGETRIAFSADNSFDLAIADHDRSEGERWALNCLCDALIERGALVPVSSKSVNRL